MSPRPPTAIDSAKTRDSRSRTNLDPIVRCADALAYSSVLATAIAASLSLAASRTLRAPGEIHWATLAATGTFIIYSLDRFRDVERDRLTSPARTAFVLHHRRALGFTVGLAAIVFAIALLQAPWPIIALCVAIGSVGFFHRRLKRFSALKAAYVSIAWIAACIGMPWIAIGGGEAGLWACAILFPTLAANLHASNLRDDEAPLLSRRSKGTGSGLWLARAATGLAIVIALGAPPDLRALVWIPLFEALALAAFRASERYGHLAVDGALLAGALATCIAAA